MNPNLTSKDIQEAIDLLHDNAINNNKDFKPTMLVGKKFLQNLYEKEGKEVFKSILESCSVSTSEEGIDYINSLNLFE